MNAPICLVALLLCLAVAPAEATQVGPVAVPRIAHAPASAQIIQEPAQMDGDPSRMDDGFDETIVFEPPTISPPEIDHVDPSKRGSWTIHVQGRIGYIMPDGTFMGVFRQQVGVIDEDEIFNDDTIGWGTTDDFGFFSFTVFWDPCLTCDSTPDIYLLVSGLRIGVWEDYTGTTLDVGTRIPGVESRHQALHFERARDIASLWFPANGYGMGIFLPAYEPFLYYPPSVLDAPSAMYRIGYSYNTVSYHPETSLWGERFLLGWLGEHFLYYFGTLWERDMCNGVCDGTASDCDYCLWCVELPWMAWQRGFGEGVGAVLTDHFAAYSAGVEAITAGDLESLGSPCAASVADPWNTPGNFAALLYDMVDENNDDHPEYPGVRDVMSIDLRLITEVARTGDHQSVLEFLQAFMDAYPSLCGQLWETAANCGLNLDLEPSTVSGLTSPSHPTGGSYTDVTAEFEWNLPFDECSGITGYSIEFSSVPVLPDQTVELGPVVRYTSDPLEPGTWYFNIRAVDRAGNWHPLQVSYGPFTIVDPTPSDLAHELQAGWSAPVVPRSAAGATSGNVVVGPDLVGDADSYWNVAPKNIGGLATGLPLVAQLYVDGNRYIDLFTPGAPGAAPIPSLAGHAFVELLDEGPVNVRAGRHMFGVELDSGGGLVEPDEINNGWARSWVWRPDSIISADVPLGATSVPDYNGGWNYWGGGVLWPNSLGVRFASTGRWNAFYTFADHEDSDFDLHLHQPASSPEIGFFDVETQSNRGERFLDAVFVNRDLTGGTQSWDAAIIQGDFEADDGAVGYGHVTSTSFTFGVEYSDQLDPGEPIHLRDFDLPAGSTGPVSIVVDVDPSQGKLTVLRLASDYDIGHIGLHDGIGATDDEGHARLRFTLPEAGNMCIVLYRNKWQNDYTGPLAYTIRVETTPPDMRPDFVGGWHAPIVPRPANDATPTSVPAPTSLIGWQPATWFSLAQENVGDTVAPAPMASSIRIDGVELWSQPIPGPVAPQGHHVFNNLGVFSVKGGRHTLTMHSDATDDVGEISETNNAYGEQWAWSPLIAGWTPVTGMSQPASRTGGWSDVVASSPATLWYNAEGLRTPHVDPASSEIHWVAVAVAPQEDSDVDVRLHPEDDDPSTAFSTSLARSEWSVGNTDFVLINYWLTPPGRFDAGVLGVSGDGGYQYDLAYDDYVGTPQGTHGPFTLAPNELIGLHEFWFDQGIYTIELQDLSATADLGFSLHGWQLAQQGKSDHLDGAIAWLEPVGSYQTMRATIIQPGPYCIAVWKSDATGAPLSSDYAIKFLSVTDSPPSEAFAGARIVQIAPNPFNPRTEIVYRTENRGEVTVSIYNVRGEFVREVDRGVRSPGQHRVNWDGFDAAGRFVASGVYVVQVEGEAWTDRRKITLLK